MFNSYLFVLLIKVIVTYKCFAPPEGEHINTDTGSTSNVRKKGSNMTFIYKEKSF